MLRQRQLLSELNPTAAVGFADEINRERLDRRALVADQRPGERAIVFEIASGIDFRRRVRVRAARASRCPPARARASTAATASCVLAAA